MAMPEGVAPLRRPCAPIVDSGVDSGVFNPLPVGASGPIVRGGRYDDLVGRYGAALPATGLAFDLDALEQALEQALAATGAEIEGGEPSSARLVAIASVSARARRSLGARLRAAAVREAALARARGLRAWIDREPKIEQAQHMAERRQAQRLTWLFVEGRGAAAKVVRQRWRRGATGWRKESEKMMSKQGQEQS